VDEKPERVEDVTDSNPGTRPGRVIVAQERDVPGLAQQDAIVPVGRPDNHNRVTGSLETQP
jgi:hypothetical protein